MSVLKILFSSFIRTVVTQGIFICSQTKKCVPSVSILSAGL